MLTFHFLDIFFSRSVVKYYLNAFYAARKSGVAKKPYNPILGETFRCRYVHILLRVGVGRDLYQFYSILLAIMYLVYQVAARKLIVVHFLALMRIS